MIFSVTTHDPCCAWVPGLVFTYICSDLLFLLFFFRLLGAQPNNCSSRGDRSHRCRAETIGSTCFFRFCVGTRTWSRTQQICTAKNLKMVRLPEELSASSIKKIKRLTDKSHDGAWLDGMAIDLGNWTFVNKKTPYLEERYMSQNFKGIYLV